MQYESQAGWKLVLFAIYLNNFKETMSNNFTRLLI